jgi:hypothetical protein
VQSLGLVVLFADKEWQESVDVETYLKSNGMEGVKYVALFDYGASEEMTASDLLWLAAANTDPRRDIRLVGDTVVVDATVKKDTRVYRTVITTDIMLNAVKGWLICVNDFVPIEI